MTGGDPLTRSFRRHMTTSSTRVQRFSQAVKIRDAIVNRSSNTQDPMREQLAGACRAALDVLYDASE
jgi:hypothetical protein